MSGSKKYMIPVRIKRARGRDGTIQKKSGLAGGSKANFASYLPAVYAGLNNRVDRYKQYDQMDQDAEISTGLDIISEFCTQNSEDFESALMIHYKDNSMGDTEVKTLENRLDAWVELNSFIPKMFEIFRNILKYGDQFFIRDPETYEWIWVNPCNVEKVTADLSRGKKPVLYFIKDISLDLKNRVASQNTDINTPSAYPGSLPHTMGQSNSMSYGSSSSGSFDNSPFPASAGQQTTPVLAEHVIHISLTTGMSEFFPFGTSILENIFKSYKQKELLEDSIIIYRVQRAPERRVFKIDVGDMTDAQARTYVNRIKDEIHQRRIPSSRGGSSSMVDAAYNPMSILEDYFFPQTSDGRGSSVETLPGGDNLGQIDDLRWFNNKLIRGLKIPQSYLPFGPEDTGHVVNDGRIGAALIQEFRFNKYCQRLQNTVSSIFDEEFKAYLKESGYQFNYKSFSVKFRPPMNFASYRKAELESTLINAYSALNELPYIAKRTILTKMGWTQDEILENERLWMEENPDKSSSAGSPINAPDLKAVGVENPAETPELSGADGIQGDQGMGDMNNQSVTQGSSDSF